MSGGCAGGQLRGAEKYVTFLCISLHGIASRHAPPFMVFHFGFRLTTPLEVVPGAVWLPDPLWTTVQPVQLRVNAPSPRNGFPRSHSQGLHRPRLSVWGIPHCRSGVNTPTVCGSGVLPSKHRCRGMGPEKHSPESPSAVVSTNHDVFLSYFSFCGRC